jgi:hypothetical protein
MVVLALVGVGLTAADQPLARRYWMWLVPVYGLLCVATAWSRSRQDASLGLGPVLRQVLHWVVIGGAMALDFWMGGTGAQARGPGAFDALLLLTVGCLLAGVHLDALLLLVGALLALTLVAVVKAAQYLWLLFVAGVLVLLVIAIGARVFRGSARQGDEP